AHDVDGAGNDERRGVASRAIEERAGKHGQGQGGGAPGDVETSRDQPVLVLVPVASDGGRGEAGDDAVAGTDEGEPEGRGKRRGRDREEDGADERAKMRADA